ncbi:MAG: RNA-binding domain-containing protein [Nitrosopumilaceae archaeon]
MKIPEIACKIEAYCAVNPSEDSDKVRQAVSNVLSDMDYKYEDGSIKASSRNPQCLSKIYEVIRSRKATRTYRRQMRYNLNGDTTWFYLNKQAAFVNVIAICEQANESPLGPIKIILHSKNIERIMEWLVPELIE